MISRRDVFEIHRLKDLGYSERMIARTLKIGRNTVKKYLCNPDSPPAKRVAGYSKLDPHRDFIKQLIEKHPGLSAPVVLQRLCERGFDGKITIVRDYLRQIRQQTQHKRAYRRFESDPGQQMQIDWGHFGGLNYTGANRRLYALAVSECYSRMLYVEFTHSQNQSALHLALLNAFKYFGGSPREIVVDNMLTAVTERVGTLVRFNDAFLDFLRVFKVTPIACNIRAPHEKGKVENAIKYLRYNFLPLRSFLDLEDAQRQVMQWLETVANKRKHRTTGEQPLARFKSVLLRALPDKLPDCRETLQLLAHKDLSVRFETNAYSVPARVIGKKLTVKADKNTVSIYDRDRKIAVHCRCWGRHKRIEIAAHLNEIRKLHKKLMLDRQVVIFLSLGKIASVYLEAIVEAKLSVKKEVSRLLVLRDEYGTQSILLAMDKALAHGAVGIDYIENILYQEMTPACRHPPVKLKDKSLNSIQLTEPQLADYDAFVLKRRRHD